MILFMGDKSSKRVSQSTRDDLAGIGAGRWRRDNGLISVRRDPLLANSASRDESLSNLISVGRVSGTMPFPSPVDESALAVTNLGIARTGMAEFTRIGDARHSIGYA